MANRTRPRWGLILFVCIIFAGIWNANDKKTPAPPLTAEQKAENEKREAQWAEAVVVARTLRQSMKNPRSFELEQALRMENGALCFSYRATNSFNAIVPGYAVYQGGKIHASDHDGFQARWNRHCGGKTGSSISGLAYAL